MRPGPSVSFSRIRASSVQQRLLMGHVCLCVPMYVCTCALVCRCQYQESSLVTLPPYLLDKGSQSDQELTNTDLQPAYSGDLLFLLEMQADGHTHPKYTWVIKSPNSCRPALWYSHWYGKLSSAVLSLQAPKERTSGVITSPATSLKQ